MNSIKPFPEMYLIPSNDPAAPGYRVRPTRASAGGPGTDTIMGPTGPAQDNPMWREQSLVPGVLWEDSVMTSDRTDQQ